MRVHTAASAADEVTETGPGKVSAPHSMPAEAVLDALAVATETGLSADEAERRRKQYGSNLLKRIRRRSVWLILADQFRSIIVLLLSVAAILSFAFRDWTEGVAILAVLAINAAIGFTTEFRAARSMDALRQIATVTTRVRREGEVASIPARDLVPGDIVLLEGGDVITADLRLIGAESLQCDESALTGESVPVRKSASPVDAGTPLAERASMAFKGTAVTSGTGTGIVVATGMGTELGGISALVAEAEAERSPLEERLDRLGRQLVWATLALTAGIAGLGILQGKDILTVLQTAIALAVAAVPEGLPIVATVALARGMWRMAARNVLIERLSAVETLGATTIILTDKTGTLTENRMSVARMTIAEGEVQVASGPEGATFTRGGEAIRPMETPVVAAALRVAALCNNASLSSGDPHQNGIGDPTEIALLVAAVQGGVEPSSLARSLPRARQEPFSSETRMMATLHRNNGRWLVAAKGAPEAVLRCADHILGPEGTCSMDAGSRDAWLSRNDEMARRGLRVLALAQRESEQEPADLYEDLTLIGLVGLADPPRPDVADAIATCRDAGVRVVMLTGDHAATATAIAETVGIGRQGQIVTIASPEIEDAGRLAADERKRLLDAAVFARISPKAKLDIVGLHQRNGGVVAMTGDGVNDAPALKKADIGIAMGQRGTQVAREAADMVLRDDSFASIVAATREGRVIFANIRRFVMYLLSCNLSEIMVIGVATLAALPLPLLPLQILYLNLVTDIFPAFALGIGEGGPDVLHKPPRNPREPILGRARWIAITGYGALITAATLGAFALSMTHLGMDEREALTISFLTLALAQLWHVFNMRERGSGVLRNEISTSPYVWGALAICLALVVAALYVPALARILGLTAPGPEGWLLAGAASLVPLAIGQVAKAVPIRKSQSARH